MGLLSDYRELIVIILNLGASDKYFKPVLAAINKNAPFKFFKSFYDSNHDFTLGHYFM